MHKPARKLDATKAGLRVTELASRRLVSEMRRYSASVGWAAGRYALLGLNAARVLSGTSGKPRPMLADAAAETCSQYARAAPADLHGLATAKMHHDARLCSLNPLRAETASYLCHEPPSRTYPSWSVSLPCILLPSNGRGSRLAGGLSRVMVLVLSLLPAQTEAIGRWAYLMRPSVREDVKCRGSADAGALAAGRACLPAFLFAFSAGPTITTPHLLRGSSTHVHSHPPLP